jgi:hypothetical protein
MKLKFHTDPGHGWVEVPHTLIKKLNIGDRISGYSYMTRDAAYLEEDCDMAQLGRALEDRGDTLELEYCHSNHYSSIRDLPRYKRSQAA